MDDRPFTDEHFYFALLCVAATRITSVDWWVALDPNQKHRAEVNRIQGVVGDEIRRLAKKLFPEHD